MFVRRLGSGNLSDCPSTPRPRRIAAEKEKAEALRVEAEARAEAKRAAEAKAAAAAEAKAAEEKAKEAKEAKEVADRLQDMARSEMLQAMWGIVQRTVDLDAEEQNVENLNATIDLIDMLEHATLDDATIDMLEEKNAPGISNRRKTYSYCPWLVVASAYYATPFVYVSNLGLGP
eukprot:3405288-Pyramimonas_sp.AAC.1